jgi:hypothetical protein
LDCGFAGPDASAIPGDTLRFLHDHNAQAKPFQWVADPDEIMPSGAGIKR